MLSRFHKSREPAFPFTVDLDQSKVYSAGSDVSGVVHLKPDPGIKELRVSLRGGQHATYEGASFAGGQRPIVEVRVGVAVFIHEYQTLWTPENSTEGTIDLPFLWKLPSMEEQRVGGTMFPPSFEGGSRPSNLKLGKGNVNGNQIGSTLYLIKVEAIRASDSPKGSKQHLLLPFIYLPPATVPTDFVPPPIFPPPATVDSTLPILPPPRPRNLDGWRTSKRVQVVKDKLFKAPGAMEITIHTPDLPAYPTSHPIPFFFHLLVLSPPSPPPSAGTPPPQLRIPSPSAISLTLERFVLARAQGFQQVAAQQGSGLGLVVADLSKEQRVWYEETSYRPPADGEEAGRWSRGMSIVGEMRFEGDGVGPSFDRGEKELLGCGYAVSLHISQKGVGSDIQIDKLLPVVLSSQVTRNETTEGRWEGGRMEFPPSYFEAAGGKVPPRGGR